MEQENAEMLIEQLLEPMDQENSENINLDSSRLTEEKVNAMDTSEPEQMPEKMEESDKKDDCSTVCKWEENVVIKSEPEDSIVTKIKVEIETEMEDECQKEIEFEVDINEIKKEINDSKETLEESKQLV